MYGDYTIVTRIHSYNNPTNTGQFRGSNRCCDNERQSGICSFNRRCDNRFTFCLKVFGDMTDGTDSCVSDVLMSLESEINLNDVSIDFTASRWLGLDNPLMLNGVSTAWQVFM